MSLDAIARKYGTDKYFKLGGGHNYTPFYDMILKGRDVTSMLEIGVQGGESLKMWRDYFPEAMIYGWDIVDLKHLDSDRILNYVVDQGKASRIAEFFDKNDVMFDFVIDDGSHKVEDQIVSLFNIWPYLNQGGVYIIEDMWHDIFDCFLYRSFRDSYFYEIDKGIIEIAGVERVNYLLNNLVCVQKNNVVFSSSDDKTDHIFYTFFKK